jgi:tRNA (cytidine/uridine-2'-O-)-methyltransferase
MTEGSLRLALFQPDIPQNAGTLLRACACLGLGADLIEPAGFATSDRHFRRSGMDYLGAVALVRHASFAAFEAWRATPSRDGAAPRRLVLLTTGAALDYRDFAFEPDDVLMVGRESAGVPPEVHAAAAARIVVAMRPGFRSLNVAVAAAMVLGEALRQIRAAEAVARPPSASQASAPAPAPAPVLKQA